ncbi:MAG: pentapeptide repeat-containing protein [Myxococcales bacterium]|nr:pentapeptide repeat-containing protein [Myxococcales bacterium]
MKPGRLAALTRVVEQRGRRDLVVSVAVLFGLEPPQPLLPEVSLWQLVAAELGEGAVLDEWLPKPRGELLVTGKAFAPLGTTAGAVRVKVRVGAVDKELVALGDRHWLRGGASEPEPFAEMPLGWERAFGGGGYERNPLGKGFAPTARDGQKVHPLPNVEDPRRLVAASSDRPEPAGFGAYPLTWPQRYRKIGTYGSRWLEERYPGFADDLDPTFFNVAPEDQWLDGFWRGDEELAVEGMHPDKAVVRGRLPGVRARAFVNLRRAGALELCEVALACDTVHLFPHRDAGIVILRGATPVVEADASDVAHLLCGLEDLAEETSRDHYAAVLQKRLDPEKGALFALRDRDLLPAARRVPADGVPHPLASFSDMDELVKSKGLLKTNLRRGANERVEAARQKLLAHGLEPGDFKLPTFEPDAPPPDAEDLADFVAEKRKLADDMLAEAEVKKAALEARSRAACAEHGLDYDAMMAAGAARPPGPRKPSADARLGQLRDMAALGHNAGVDVRELEALGSNDDFVAALRDGDAREREMYRKFAHLYPEPLPTPPVVAARLRAEVARGYAAHEDFAERDLSGADLSGMDLRGARFAHAFLESADLRGADLSDAALAGAVLARAKLSGAKLARGELTGANLGAADLSQADLGAARLGEAILMRAVLEKASLAGAELERANLFEATLRGAELERVHAPGLVFIRAELTDSRWAGAMLEKCSFVECALAGVDFSEANLTKATFVTCRADSVSFRGATLEGTSFPKDTTLERADFRAARMPASNLRGARARGADFRGATADSADFSEADLAEARFEGARAHAALFIGSDLRRAGFAACDLTRALLQRANIRGTSFAKANLFRADFAYVNGDRGTSFEGALMDQIRFVEERREGRS